MALYGTVPPFLVLNFLLIHTRCCIRRAHILHMSLVSGHMGLGHCPLTQYLNWMKVHFHAILPSIATSTPAHFRENLGEPSVIFPPHGEEVTLCGEEKPCGRCPPDRKGSENFLRCCLQIALRPRKMSTLPTEALWLGETMDGPGGKLGASPLSWLLFVVGWMGDDRWPDDSCNWLAGTVFDGMTRYYPLKFVGDSATWNRMGWYGIDGDGRSHLWLWTWEDLAQRQLFWCDWEPGFNPGNPPQIRWLQTDPKHICWTVGGISHSNPHFVILIMIWWTKNWIIYIQLLQYYSYILYMPSGYLTVRHGKIHHAIKNGKQSIFMGHKFTMANCECHNQAGYTIKPSYAGYDHQLYGFFRLVSTVAPPWGPRAPWFPGQRTLRMASLGPWRLGGSSHSASIVFLLFEAAKMENYIWGYFWISPINMGIIMSMISQWWGSGKSGK